MLLQTALALCWLASCAEAPGAGADTPATAQAPVPAALDASPPRITRPPAQDRWLAEDKLRHFAVAFTGTGMGFGAARAAGLDRDPGLVVAGTAMLLAGIGKEVRDSRRGGPFSGRDLAWDLIGIAAGLALAAGTR